MANLMSKIQPTAVGPTDLMAAVAGLAELSATGVPGGHEISGRSYLDLYLSELDELSGLTGELGYPGLHVACLMFRDNVEALRGSDGGLGSGVRSALGGWPVLVQWYLELPPGAGASEALIHYLQLPLWDVPLDPGGAEVLRALLLEKRQQTAARGV